MANRNNASAAIGTLDQRKLERNTGPGCVLSVDLSEPGSAARIGVAGYLFGVPTNTRVDVGVIDSSSADFYQDFAGTRARHWHICMVFKLLSTPMPLQKHSVHGLG
ncbi:hypothetical protein D3C72_1434430 [compost metagenome]